MIDRITTALSRRNVLLGLAASATAATATGAAAAPQENPELVSLADTLPATLAAYVAARETVAWIMAEWSPQWPVPAPEIERYSGGSQRHVGIEAAKAQRTAALDALHSHVDAIMRGDDWTITGAVIKAQALGAWSKAEHYRRVLNPNGPAWADLLAASILRHAGGGHKAA